MAEIGSEYGVPKYKCIIKKQKLEHHKHEDCGRKESDSEASQESSLDIAMTCKPKGITADIISNTATTACFLLGPACMIDIIIKRKGLL